MLESNINPPFFVFVIRIRILKYSSYRHDNVWGGYEK